MGVALENVPGNSVCDYLLEPVKEEEEEEEEEEQAQGKGQKPGNETSESKAEASKPARRSGLVIFAVDVSGSMSTTTTVPDLQGQFHQW